MTTLFIANCTRQNHLLWYTHPDMTRQGIQQISPGCQIGIKDLNPISAGEIIKVHEALGMRNISDIDRIETFVGHVYSIDKPVPSSRIMYVIERNKVAQDAEARRHFDIAAAATAKSLDEKAPEMRVDIKSLGIAINEVKDPYDNGPGFSRENTFVDAKTLEGSSSPAPRKRGRPPKSAH